MTVLPTARAKKWLPTLAAGYAVAAGYAMAVAGVTVAGISAGSAQAKPRLPEIRLSATNQVPACVTPARLMQFVHARNKSRKLRRLYKDIAIQFEKHGQALGVRWDYAFYQTLIETNYLTYRTGSGRLGDVDPKQYNFAGIGTTGGGVPGNGFPDVSTGVLAQMQHLIAYSGAFPKNPVAARTRLKQGEIVALSRKLRRPVRFDDLAGRWAVDRRYANSIEFVARSYRKRFCGGARQVVARAGANGRGQPIRQVGAGATVAAVASRQRRNRQVLSSGSVAKQTLSRSRAKADALAKNAIDNAIDNGRAFGGNRLAALGASSIAAFANSGSKVPASVPAPKRASRCRVMTASYGGKKTILIKVARGPRVTYTALGVLDGFEKSMTDSYIQAYAKGGKAVAEFASQNEALSKAFTLCPAPAG